MSLLIYIIKTMVISGALVSYYWFFLRNRSFHNFNRFFLLSIPFLSFIIPVLHFTPPIFWNHGGGGSPIHLLQVASGTLEEAVTVYGFRKKVSVFSREILAASISVGLSLFFLFRLISSLRFLQNLKKQNPFIHLKEATLFFVSEKGTPFSFFKSIFWGRQMELTSTEGEQILRHELFHVQQQHSLDNLFLESCTILMWFNPFLHIIRLELKAIHEYAADAYAAPDGDGYAYAKLLLSNYSGTTVSIAHPFFKKQIKRRILMLTKSNHGRKTWMGRFMILPLLLFFIGLFSFKFQTSSMLSSAGLFSLSTTPQTSPVNTRVIIDPGHGGAFSGTVFNGIYEKNINLSISNKIRELAKDYHVDVIMTRENDEDKAGNNLDASLKYRTGLAAENNADLFISIHVNATGQNAPQEKYSGFEIYVPGDNSPFHTESVKLASGISAFIKTHYTIASELKERERHIRILDQCTVPAILIECGYIDNPANLTWMLSEKDQEKIARDILEGIQQYGHHSASYDSLPKVNVVATKSLKVTESAATVKNLQVKEVQQIKQVQLVNQDTRINTHDTTHPKRKVEVEAGYPGGAGAWTKYLFQTLKYPDDAISKEIQGEVVVEFVVNEDGTLTDIHAISGPQKLRAESVRVITQSGKWTPARDQGAIVASFHKQPIIYKLETK